MMHHTNLENICDDKRSATLFYAYGHRSNLINWLNNITLKSENEIQPLYEQRDVNIWSQDKKIQETIPVLSCPYLDQNILLARNSEYPAFVMFEKKKDSKYAKQIALALQCWYIHVTNSNFMKITEIVKGKTSGKCKITSIFNRLLKNHFLYNITPRNREL